MKIVGYGIDLNDIHRLGFDKLSPYGKAPPSLKLRRASLCHARVGNLGTVQELQLDPVPQVFNILAAGTESLFALIVRDVLKGDTMRAVGGLRFDYFDVLLERCVAGA